MKSLPLITKRFAGKMRECYLVTSDYHIPRSKAIFQQFKKHGAVKFDLTFRGSKNSDYGAKKDSWLHDPKQMKGNFECRFCEPTHAIANKIEEIQCVKRDESNAKIFASLIAHVKEEEILSMSQRLELVNKYCKNNGLAVPNAPVAEKNDWWRAALARLGSPIWSTTGSKSNCDGSGLLHVW